MTFARIYAFLFVAAVIVASAHGAYAGVGQTLP
jgi:hypothetical protein